MVRHDGIDDPDAGPPAPAAGGRRWTSWLTLALGLGLLAWVLSQVSLAQLAGVLRRADASMLAAALALGLAIAAAMIGINACGQLAFASPLPWTLCWLASAVVLAVTMLPVHGPLGLGTLEVSWVGLMALYDVPVPDAVGIAVGLRLLSLAIILVDGLLGLALLSFRASPAAADQDRSASR